MCWDSYRQIEKRRRNELLGCIPDGSGSHCRLVDSGPRRDETQGREENVAQGHDEDLFVAKNGAVNWSRIFS